LFCSESETVYIRQSPPSPSHFPLRTLLISHPSNFSLFYTPTLLITHSPTHPLVIYSITHSHFLVLTLVTVVLRLLTCYRTYRVTRHAPTALPHGSTYSRYTTAMGARRCRTRLNTHLCARAACDWRTSCAPHASCSAWT
jgi:hypothetical protein